MFEMRPLANFSLNVFSLKRIENVKIKYCSVVVTISFCALHMSGKRKDKLHIIELQYKLPADRYTKNNKTSLAIIHCIHHCPTMGLKIVHEYFRNNRSLTVPRFPASTEAYQMFRTSWYKFISGIFFNLMELISIKEHNTTVTQLPEKYKLIAIQP